MKAITFYRILLVALALFLADARSFATKYHIDVQDFQFSPSDIQGVKVGDTIEWEWKNGTHTTTSTSVPAGAAAWDHPITSSSTVFDYIPVVAGTYHYKCTPHASMGMVGSFTVVSATAVPPVSSPVRITLYPNPFTDVLNIKLHTEGENRIEQLRVYDMAGRVVSDYSFKGWEGDIEKQVLFPSQVAGILILEFRESDGSVVIRRVIKE